MGSYSRLQGERADANPAVPKTLQHLSVLTPRKGVEVAPSDNTLKTFFPHTFRQPLVEFVTGESAVGAPLTVGVVFSGGQAAGGHNVVIGLYEALKTLHPDSALIGFLDGPKGILDNRYLPLTQEALAGYRNQGGFDLLGSGRDKIDKQEHFAAAARTARERKLDGLVIIGGDDSNTNAAWLAEYFLAEAVPTRVVGVPKTIDGDLKNAYIEVSFGFDTAVKTFANAIGSILRDALSAKKYYFFIKLMGRSASHIALGCALQTHPNMTLIGEEIKQKGTTLAEITTEIADMICERAKAGKHYGAVLVPEGLIEFIPECQLLIAELNTLLAAGNAHSTTSNDKTKVDAIASLLSERSRQTLGLMPFAIQTQLLLDRDPHGNVKVSQIETERLLIAMVKAELKRRQFSGFHAQPLFFGYEGRSCLPSLFDSNYCYALGLTAALLINGGLTGYMSTIGNLIHPVAEWKPGGVPLVSMMEIQERHGKQKPVIKKALVDLEGKPFTVLSDLRTKWKCEDNYLYPGPIQFYGSQEVSEAVSLTQLFEAEAKVAADLV